MSRKVIKGLRLLVVVISEGIRVAETKIFGQNKQLEPISAWTTEAVMGL